jgi:hypothetical protein
MLIDNRMKILLAIIVAAVIAIFSIDPIAQQPSYHDFADQRRMLGVANFFNVLSNLLFVIIGVIGMRLVALGQATGGLAELRPMYLTFFVGVFLTGFGSAYYHYQPGNQTLLWDRLPMTIAFMALFSAIIGEYVSTRLADRLFAPLLIFGAASVIYWYVTELNGHGDLRAYVLVQFLPVLLIPLILWLFESTLNNGRYIWGIIGAYAASKLMELFDTELYGAFGLLSGHSLKHLTAAFGTLIFYWALRERDVSPKK